MVPTGQSVHLLTMRSQSQDSTSPADRYRCWVKAINSRGVYEGSIRVRKGIMLIDAGTGDEAIRRCPVVASGNQHSVDDVLLASHF
jgi:hypothetical protein